jgi:WhiB family redox-sensing transcriptional regulator
MTLPTDSGDVRAWMADAACRTYAVDYWFSETPGTSYSEAKAVCDTCPVRSECLKHALDHEDYGVWGGLTPRERDLYRKGLPVGDRRRKANRQ